MFLYAYETMKSCILVSASAERLAKYSSTLRGVVPEVCPFPSIEHARAALPRLGQRLLVLDLVDHPGDTQAVMASVAKWAQSAWVILTAEDGRPGDIGLVPECVRAVLPETEAESMLLHAVLLVHRGMSVRPALESAADPAMARLSPREREVLQRVALGESNKAVSEALNLSDHTVRVHMRSILKKLGLQNRTQAALWATGNQTAISSARPPLKEPLPNGCL